MFNTNGIPAVLIKYNRSGVSDYYDDQDKVEENIVVCPYNVDQDIQFGTYTHPEATGYYILKNTVDVREGDQIVFRGQTHTILQVQDNWLWNKIANFMVSVK